MSTLPPARLTGIISFRCAAIIASFPSSIADFPPRPAQVPEPTLATLRAAANENAVSVFRYLSETRRLCDLLEQAGVPVRVLKGVPLSQAVFGDASVRDVGDIDLLIAPHAEETADRILIADGFFRNDPAAPLTPRRRLSWQRHGKDYTYRSNRDDFEIDLHWRLFRNPHMPGNALADTGASGSQARFGEISLSVLPLDRSFLYLCVHGALDGWSRFKSLVDIATLWRSFPAEQRNMLADEARAYGVLPEMAAALRLAQEIRLLEADLLTAPMQLQTGSREARWILEYARRQHLAHRFQPTQEKAGSWQLKRYEFGLRRGLDLSYSRSCGAFCCGRVCGRVSICRISCSRCIHCSVRWSGFCFTGKARPPAKRACGGVPGVAGVVFAFAQKRLLLEAFATLLAARVSLALLPVRWIFRWLERPLRHPAAAGQRDASAAGRPDVVERIRWAVLTVARYGPLSFVCFPQALAAHAMLRRRGVGSVMHYGVRRSADRQMRAHTWLEVDNRMLLGGESALLYAPIHSTGVSREQ